MKLTRGTALDTNQVFSVPADAAALERTAEALRGRGFGVYLTDGPIEAKDLVLGLIPEGAEVGAGASNTLAELGITAVLENSGRYDAIRPHLRAMDRATEGRQMRKLGAVPDFWLNSVQAVTQEGQIVLASATGSQLAPIAYGAGTVILVAGAQKVVSNLEMALARLEEYSFPLETAKMKELYGRGSTINQVLILNGSSTPGRISVVLIREAIGN